MKKLFLIVAATLFVVIAQATAFGQSDKSFKSAFLGYWESPRHTYLAKSDGFMTAASLDIMIGLCYQSDSAQFLYARQLFKGWLGGVHLDIAGRWDILVARRIATSIK